MARLIDELSGVPCLDLEAVTPAKKSIVCSRSFGQRITTLAALNEAVSLYATRAAEKLRGQASTVGCLQVFVQANPFSENPYANQISYRLPVPTNDTREMISIAKRCLKAIYKPGVAYKKAGVMLTQLNEVGVCQADLFSKAPEMTSRLMGVVDAVNQRLGSGQIYFAAQGHPKAKQSWGMQSAYRSGCYTTNWLDLPIAR